MAEEAILKILVLVFGFYMAWNIGANDVSNAMGTAVGSGTLTLRRALLVAGIFEFCGAFFVGANVSETLQHGLIDTELFLTHPITLILGMLSSLIATGVWLQIASFFGWPVSTTHAIVGAIVGFGAVVGGFDAVEWREVLFVAISWLVSPLISGLISFLLFNMLQKKILYAISPLEAAKRLMPLLSLLFFSTFSLCLIFNGLANFHFAISFTKAVGYALAVGGIFAAITYLIVRTKAEPTIYARLSSPQSVVSLEKALNHLQRVHATTLHEAHDRVTKLLDEVKSLSIKLRKETSFAERTSEYRTVERMFIYFQILSCSYVAFSHGANDVANAIGPVSAVLNIIRSGEITALSPIPTWLLVFGGMGIIIGLATWGWRVIETIGKKITELTPTRGFCAEFGAATAILIASKLGLPISTTHCLVGSVLGVGLGRGIRALNLSMIKEILLSWLITVPTAGILSILFFHLLRALFRA